MTTTILADLRRRAEKADQQRQKEEREAKRQENLALHELIARMAREGVEAKLDELKISAEMREDPLFVDTFTAVIEGWTALNPFEFQGRLPGAIDWGLAKVSLALAEERGVEVGDLTPTLPEVHAMESGVDVAAEALKQAMTDNNAAKKAAEESTD